MSRGISKYLGFIDCFALLLFSCEEEPVETISIPEGTTPFSSEEEAFLPYSSESHIYKMAPDFIEEITFEFQEETTPKNAYAWKEVKYRYATDYGFRASFRLRYYLSEVEPEKTLAIYLPYKASNGEYGQVLFETPIDSTGVSEGFFQNKVTYHTTIELEGVVYSEVFEILPLTLDDGDIDVDTYFDRIF